MTWPVIVAIAAVLPVVGLVLWLIMRPLAARPTQAPHENELHNSTDILAELEEQEIEVSVAAARKRADLRASVPATTEVANGIEWEDEGQPFRPPSVQSAPLHNALGLNLNVTVEKRKHLVCIRNEALTATQRHLESNTKVELGGLLAGRPYYVTDQDAYLVLVESAIRAPHGKESPVSFEYTTKTWGELTPMLQQIPEDQVIVGSYHSHPGLGVFMSTTDVATQHDVFPHEWQIAMVIDPICNEIGIFISVDGDPVEYVVVD